MQKNAKEIALKYFKRGLLDNAILEYKNILKTNSSDADAFMMLGVIYGQKNDYKKSIQHLSKANRLIPNNKNILLNLGVTYKQCGEPAKAKTILKALYRQNPSDINLIANLADVEISLGDMEAGIALYKKIVDLDNNRPDILKIIGNVYLSQKQSTSAIDYLEKSLKFNSNDQEAYGALGQAYASQGNIKESLNNYQICLLNKKPNDGFYSNYLLTLNYSTEHSNEYVFNEHMKWGKELVYGATCAEKSGKLQKPLKVGYVSGDIREHSVAYFLYPIISSHSKNNVSVYCYSNSLIEDGITKAFKKLVRRWKNIAGMPDGDVAKLISDDGIDILIDLSGHTSGSRMGVFALKPAPILITYLGYPYTTGCKTIDYRITDHITDPDIPEVNDMYSETLIRLPDTFLCFHPFNKFPETCSLPALNNGYITFGSFNNLSKINEKVIRLWANILNKVSDSRIVLKNPAFSDAKTKLQFLEYFESRGVSPSRLDFLSPNVDRVEHLKTYNKVDIALDTFPYNGVTTTFESLVMGVPVITLSQDRHSSRIGNMIMNNLGMKEWVANTEEEYADIAFLHTNDLDSLSNIRKNLRERLYTSVLCDSKKFTYELEKIYFDLCLRARLLNK